MEIKLTDHQREIVRQMRGGKNMGEYFFRDPIRYSVGATTVKNTTFEKLHSMKLLQKIKPVGRSPHHAYYTLTQLGREINL